MSVFELAIALETIEKVQEKIKKYKKSTKT